MKSFVKPLILTIIVLILATLFFSYKKIKLDYQDVAIVESQEHPGKKLMETNCYVCHNPVTSHDDRLAPPMIAVKKHYKNNNITKKEFIANFKKWVNKPSEEISKMPGAIRKFNIMPYAPYSEEDIEQIADYIYDNDIEQPEWFDEHYKQEQKKGMGKGKNKN
ncbi:c-type cytochrome [Pontimicrobium sp. SW4]|uniref:C-type cytochrome n=1 Tax=Pontimicrobium sp. SW4 TaxID=3153519 RepID=A0AAU7BP55_9FLAO